MAGVYSYLPLGLRVLNNIMRVIREEMNAISGQEIAMPVIHPAEIWRESGRWDAEAQASFAWPWTVTAEGRGRYLPSKAEALAEVRQLRARGLTNIDVGCMQVNLFYHPDAFDDLNQAFDPDLLHSR